MSIIGRNDDEFERALLGAASRDAPPEPRASERAWARFAASMAALGVVPSLDLGVRNPPMAAGSPGRFAQAMAAAKWVVIGAVGGGVVTFALMGRSAVAPGPIRSVASTTSVPAPMAAHVGSPSEATPSTRVTPEARPAQSRAATSSTPASPAPALGPRARPGATGSRVTRPASTAPSETSSLAAEVAALDAARGALDAGRADDALTLLQRYRREFPGGRLFPEADEMEIEGLAAKGDRAEVLRYAARFLERHPNAPQRTRVEQLAAESRE